MPMPVVMPKMVCKRARVYRFGNRFVEDELPWHNKEKYSNQIYDSLPGQTVDKQDRVGQRGSRALQAWGAASFQGASLRQAESVESYDLEKK